MSQQDDISALNPHSSDSTQDSTQTNPQQEQDQDQDQGPEQLPDLDQDQNQNQENGNEAGEGTSTAASESTENQEGRFVEGQILKLVRVRFPGNSKSFTFLFGKRRFEYGRKVVAMSDRGMAVGYINSFPYEAKFHPSMLPLRGIHKFATEQDIDKDLEHIDREKKAKTLCRDLINKHELDMELTHVEFTQFGKKAVFYFTSPARVDFRHLVKDLVTDLKMRIELRQIGLRDRTAALGGIGPCGLQLCCNSFLSKYGQVNLKMAKNQNLTLNPTRLNGVCGQLKCCLQYEDEVYREKASRLPPIGEFIQTANGDWGRVERHHILVEQFEMLTDEGKKRRYSINQYTPGSKPPAGRVFPNSFEHIVFETDHCIGLKDEAAEKATQFLKALPHDPNQAENESDEEEGTESEMIPASEQDIVIEDIELDENLELEAESGSELETGREAETETAIMTKTDLSSSSSSSSSSQSQSQSQHQRHRDHNQHNRDHHRNHNRDHHRDQNRDPNRDHNRDHHRDRPRPPKNRLDSQQQSHGHGSQNQGQGQHPQRPHHHHRNRPKGGGGAGAGGNQHQNRNQPPKKKDS